MLNQVVDLLLPPTSLGILALISLMIGGRTARRVAAVAIAILVILSIPIVPNTVLEALALPSATPEAPPQAVVILSAEGIRVTGTPDLEPGPLTLERIRAGAALARETSLPILVSGGIVGGTETSLAEMMATSLRDDFRLPARWVENRSLDTWQNAAFSADILRPLGMTRVYVVSHSWHLRRAMVAFRRAGFEPFPAPVRPRFAERQGWRDLIPSSAAWYKSYIAFHEAVGLLFYSLRA